MRALMMVFRPQLQVDLISSMVSGAFEEVALEVGSEAVADYVDSEVVDDAGELVDLSAGEELGFVDEEPFDDAVVLAADFADEVVEVCVGVNP